MRTCILIATTTHCANFAAESHGQHRRYSGSPELCLLVNSSLISHSIRFCSFGCNHSPFVFLLLLLFVCPRLSRLFSTAFSFVVKQLTRPQLFLDRTQSIAVVAHDSIHQAWGATYLPGRWFFTYKNGMDRTPSPTFLLELIFIFGLIFGAAAAGDSPLYLGST